MKARLTADEVKRYRAALETVYTMWDRRSLMEAQGQQMDPALIAQANEEAYKAFHLERQVMYFTDDMELGRITV